MSYNLTMTGGLVGLMTVFNGVTGGAGWTILLFGLGFTMFIALKTMDITNSFIYSTFMMSMIGMLLFFLTLINSYVLGVIISLLLLSMLLKILFK